MIWRIHEYYCKTWIYASVEVVDLLDCSVAHVGLYVATSY